jgi:hypothetical protein
MWPHFCPKQWTSVQRLSSVIKSANNVGLLHCMLNQIFFYINKKNLDHKKFFSIKPTKQFKFQTF